LQLPSQPLPRHSRLAPGSPHQPRDASAWHAPSPFGPRRCPVRTTRPAPDNELAHCSHHQMC
jgi:hypothetical protein